MKFLKCAAVFLSIALLSGCNFASSIDNLMAAAKAQCRSGADIQCAYRCRRNFDKS